MRVEVMAGRQRKVVRPAPRKRKVLVTERKFPHIVEIALPVNGLDVRVNCEMATFYRLRNIRPRFGRRRTRTGRDYGRWCFSDQTIADAFREQLGGERVMNTPPVDIR
jgi:hypothetical protein